ncbi:MAG: hypothetical protein V3R74_02415 [Alphaproteobacteria bacterium]
MADAPDLDSLARRFLDLWQDQVAATVSDPALADWMARLLAAPAGAVSGRGQPENEQEDDADAAAARPRGAAPAAAASGAGDGSVEQLARRLAACEERLAALESRLEGARGGARRAPRRGRS